MTTAHPQVPEIGILIVGGGVVGISTAGYLAKEGAEVAVVDAGYVGGTTANAGSLHVQMQSVFFQRFPNLVPNLEKSLYLYKLAAADWTAFQEELRADCEVKISGGLMIAEDQHQLDFLAKKARREKKLGLDVMVLGRAELDRIAPYLGPTVIGAEFCVHEGKVNPLLANAAMRRWAGERGAILLLEEPVLRIEIWGKGFRAVTAKGIVRAAKIVLAAGYHCKPLAAQVGFDLPAKGDALHMNITEGASPFITHLVQHADRPITLKQLGAGQVVIGGGWPAELGKPGEIVRNKLSSIIGNLSLAQHIIPRIGALRLIRTWAGVNTFIDGCGVIGPVAAIPGLYFAIPGDAGYTLGPLTGRLAAECVLGREPSEDISVCRAERFGSV
jgi:glycine/D-amino acid oxidase-like deaminating enzyme